MMEVDSKDVEVKKKMLLLWSAWRWNKKAMMITVQLSNCVYSTDYEVRGGEQNQKWQDVADL